MCLSQNTVSHSHCGPCKYMSVPENKQKELTKIVRCKIIKWTKGELIISIHVDEQWWCDDACLRCLCYVTDVLFVFNLVYLCRWNKLSLLYNQLIHMPNSRFYFRVIYYIFQACQYLVSYASRCNIPRVLYGNHKKCTQRYFNST